MFKDQPTIAVIGLGYVGLPLAITLARHFKVIGFDINEHRIKELQSGHDRTHEIAADILKSSPLHVSSNAHDIEDLNIYIITVPTPVTNANLPDLTPLAKASETVGKALKHHAIVVYESTVYPGVTEDFCGPILEKFSGLKAGSDFYLGYSPERINPGDKEHTVDRITKVVSGQTPIVAEILKNIYGSINNGNIFVAANIKTAEAAKVIENAQRDINIAFVNEIATIVGKLGLSIYDVLDAAGTKWNFLKFQPGLVGGHCIGVDPYYLAECARKVNHEPEIILAGRRTNENMGAYIAESIHLALEKAGRQKVANILILGLTFKENIPDLRNTKVIDIIRHLKTRGHVIEVHDPMASPVEAKGEYGIDLLTQLEDIGQYDCIVCAVPHREYIQAGEMLLTQLLKPKGLIADVKNIWCNHKRPEDSLYWSL